MSDSLVSSPLAARRGCLLAGAAALLGLGGCAAVRSTDRAEAYSNQEWLQSSANRIANLSLRCHEHNIHEAELVFGPRDATVREARAFYSA